jgi:hypothetical protein
MTLHPRPAIAGSLVTLVVMVCAVPAQATVTDQQHYSFSDSIPDDVICGVTVRHDFSGSGVYHVRVGKGDLDTLFFGQDKSESMSTLTNEANGNVVQIEHNGVVQDIKGTLVEGSIFKAVTIEAGQPIRIRDMSGRIVARDRGVVRFTYLFDTLGDHTPGGVSIDDLGVTVSGPHPLFPEDAFCTSVQPLLLA